MFFSSKKVFGLDIGTSTIKMAEVELTKGGANLLSFGFAPTPASSIQGGDISNATALAQAVKALAAQVKTDRKQVATGMWGTAVIVKKVAIPKVEKKLLDQQVRWEAEQYIPFDLNEISLAYHVTNPNAPGDTMEILLVAAQNALVSQYNNVITGAGYQLGILDVSGFALANLFELNYGKARGQTIALLNIGAATTNFVVVHDGEVIFSRDLPIGGNQYTNEIHKEMGITVIEAESLKLGATQKKEVPVEVNTIISNTNDLLTDEIRNSFDFFAASVNGISISKCFFTGGSSMMGSLVNQLAQAIGISFTPINPFQRIRPAKGFTPQYLQQISPFASVVLGLALRKVGDS